MKNLLLILAILISFSALSQTRVVNGTVKDSSGVPIPSVTVIERGTTNGTVTNQNGNY